MTTLIKSLEDYKFLLLNHGLEINEHRKHHEVVSVDDYLQLLENMINIVNEYIDSEQCNNEYRQRLSSILGVPL